MVCWAPFWRSPDLFGSQRGVRLMAKSGPWVGSLLGKKVTLVLGSVSRDYG